MAVAAIWGVLQLFAISWPTRSVRLSTVLLAFAVGAYGCGVATALVQLGYTRSYAEQSGQSLVTVVNTTGYLVAPWVEELLKATPLLLAGLSLKVRRQWGLTDFVVVGAALGAGFGLLEAVLRFGLDADRAMVRDGGWIVPDSLSPPYVPGLGQVLTSWLPAPFSQLSLGGPAVTETFTHLVWTATAGFGVGLLWRTRGSLRLLSILPITAAAAHHTVNNYAVQEHSDKAEQWLESLDGVAWAAPLVCLALAMVIDLRQLHRGKRTVPGILLASERTDGDSPAALLRYAAWRLPWSLLIVLRYVRLRRSLLYATASAPPDDTRDVHRLVAGITTRMDASDNQHAWQALNIRAWLKAVRRSRRSRERWLLLIPCVLMLPALLFLGVGSFTSTAGLQEYFSTGAGPKILMGFGAAALAWIAYQLTTLIRTWRQTSAQPLAEPLAAHRFRLGTALGAGTTGVLLLWRGLGDAGPDGRAVRTLHLLEALNTFLIYLGFALLLLSLLALFPPGTLALAGTGAVGALTTEAALNAGVLGTAGVVLMAVGAQGTGGSEPGSGKSDGVPQWLRDKWNQGREFNKENWPRYPANEVYLENGKFLDSYRPGKEIVSRKQTQISKLKPESFKEYLREIKQKYKAGTKIPDTPKARAEYPSLIGKPLKGKYYLEVPVQLKPVPDWALKEAANHGVIIRDVQGFIYRLPKGTG
ncbi:PrsW family intramembrane metalloprotease [Streptomyces cinnabarinus]|uniref:PrsW family intramembrane metalloprotease n=1 Tax=Streptomyces cinnabarinus TaxID=67287 RepID=A0ABY7KDM3_9ACTN|nr:PrsW family glutamic-type intramembrane protease [Streptomyces cinnabarinus]WAZ22634.1 PrsW family intramembrane metalloprotease [Streptomyces cinnabarinus]